MEMEKRQLGHSDGAAGIPTQGGRYPEAPAKRTGL